jgi:hypothetical protein
VRTTQLLASLAATATLVAGCGSANDPAEVTATTSVQPPNGVEKLSAAGIVAKAEKAARQASAVRIKGDVTENGERIRFDMHLLADRGGTGTLTVQGGSVQIIRIGRQAYMKGGTAFWTAAAGSAAAELLAGRYLKMPTSEPEMAALISFTDVDGLMTELFKDTRDEDLRKGREKQTDDRRAITVTMTGADGGILYVALDGKPYPLRIESLPDAKDRGNVVFLDYDEPFALEAPPTSQTIDISKLQSG